MNASNQENFMTFNSENGDVAVKPERIVPSNDGLLKLNTLKSFQAQNINDIRKSIIVRESKKNECLNPACL